MPLFTPNPPAVNCPHAQYPPHEGRAWPSWALNLFSALERENTVKAQVILCIVGAVMAVATESTAGAEHTGENIVFRFLGERSASSSGFELGL